MSCTSFMHTKQSPLVSSIYIYGVDILSDNKPDVKDQILNENKYEAYLHRNFSP